MKHLLILTCLALTMLFTSCSKEPDTEQTLSGTRLCLTLDGGAISVQGASRATTNTRAVVVDESAVNNLWVLQFDASGTQLTKQYIASVTDPSAISLPTTLSATANSALYVVVNTGNASLFTNQTLAQAKAVTVALTTTTGGGFPTDTSTSLPMVGQSSALTFPLTGSIAVNLTRTAAKVTLTVKNALTTGYPQLTVTSTQLKNVPKSYSTQIVDAASGFTGTTYYPSASAANFTDYTAVTGDIPAAGTTSTYYLAPNVRGVSTNTESHLKTDATAVAGQGVFCTYVEILGTAKASATAPTTNVRYRLYLGGNNTNDFNVQSNTAYKVGIELAGLYASDARLTITTDKFDLTQGGTDGDHTGDAGNGWKESALEVDKNGILTAFGKMLFFQFGSVVGFTQEGAWSANKVLFNPVTGSPSYATYTSIPIYTSADWNANRKNISDATYHNGTNVKAGKGDPCKLVGLTAVKIQSMTAAQLDTYDSGWRLPTEAEWLAFTGQVGNNSSYSAHWTASDSRYNNWYYSTGSAGAYFPMGQESQKLNYLPAAGVRNNAGDVTNVGLYGNYWTGMVGSTGACCMSFSSSAVYPFNHIGYTVGHGVRCVVPPPPPPVIGDLRDNGIVYWVDGEKYKVVSVTEWGNKTWAANNTYVIGAGAQSDTDSKANAAAIKAYFDANTGTVGADFKVAFPAAAECYNYRGKDGTDPVGTWYLPAKTDLQYLWCAFNGKAPIGWATGTNAAAPADAAAQIVFNKYLTDAGGAVMVKSYFCSGTEHSNSTSNAWYVYFSNGLTDNYSKFNGYFVRCVRGN